jgi:16S rRNA (cytosine967-C5)-methyltransferase
MIAPARVAAYEILSAVSAGNADLPTAIAFAREGLHDDRDRALASEIAAGVQRWRGALDHLIVEFSKRSIDRIDSEVVVILRLSAYQLLHLTRVPASAIVDDGVNLTRRAGKSSASGFVNAVLRTISRRRHSLPLPPRPVSPHDREAAIAYLTIALSHPRWLVTRWFDRLGLDAAEAWLLFNNSPAPLTLRANRLRVTTDALAARLAEEGIAVSRAKYAPDALIVDGGNPLRGRGLADGWFIAQDEASQLVGLLAAASPGARALDTCASPGGKTTAIAAAMQNRGLLVACDVRSRRVELLRHTVETAGASIVRIVQADLSAPLPFRQPFDSVLVDAPCSGLGTLRRDPDIRWRRRESDLATLAAEELRMLQHAADVVAPGGRLIYATCSSEPEENEQVAGAFLDAAAGFTPVHARVAAPSLPETVVDAHGHLRTLPHVNGLEAFFAAVFEKRR